MSPVWKQKIQWDGVTWKLNNLFTVLYNNAYNAKYLQHSGNCYHAYLYLDLAKEWVCSLLLLDVDLLYGLGLGDGLGLGLDGGGLDDDGLVGAADHLGPDQGELLLVQEDGDLLDLAVGANNLLHDLDTAGRGLRRVALVHLLRLQLYHLHTRYFRLKYFSNIYSPSSDLPEAVTAAAAG